MLAAIGKGLPKEGNFQNKSNDLSLKNHPNLEKSECHSDFPEDFCHEGYATTIVLFHIYFLLPVIACGLFGNFMAIAVFLRKKESSKTFALLIWLSVADGLYLISSIIRLD